MVSIAWKLVENIGLLAPHLKALIALAYSGAREPEFLARFHAAISLAGCGQAFETYLVDSLLVYVLRNCGPRGCVITKIAMTAVVMPCPSVAFSSYTALSLCKVGGDSAVIPISQMRK